MSKSQPVAQTKRLQCVCVHEGPEMRERILLGKWKWVNMAKTENDRKGLKEETRTVSEWPPESGLQKPLKDSKAAQWFIKWSAFYNDRSSCRERVDWRLLRTEAETCQIGVRDTLG